MPTASKSTTFEPKKLTLPREGTVVMVVDMQNDFVNEDGKLYVGDSVRKIIPNIQGTLAKAREKNVPIIYTQDWHRKDDREFKIWPAHCVEETVGAEIIQSLKPASGDFIIRKKSYDPWFETELEELLRRLKTKTTVVTGTVSNICVLHAVAGATLRGYETVVPMDCIAALNDVDQEFAFRQIVSLYKGVLTTSELLSFQ
jgi:nicotinamidase-related amidase